MEGPGMSLFQGAASIHINNSAQDRLEEQEELEDQKRRNEELQQNLDNAFDDLQVDDDNSSVNSSGNYTLDATRANGVHHPTRTGLPPTYVESLNHLKETQHGSDSPKHYHETPKNNLQHLRNHEDAVKCPYSPFGAGDGQNHYFNQDVRGQLNGINSYDARQEFMSNEQLKFLYEMRVKECEQYATQIEALDTETDNLRAKLLAAVHDKDKAQSSLQEAHHLLASSKHKSMELEQQVVALREQMAQGEHDKEQLRLELRAADSALRDAQQRLHTLQVRPVGLCNALARPPRD